MRAFLLLLLPLAGAASAASIDESRYRFESGRSLKTPGRVWGSEEATVADGETIVHLGAILQRFVVEPEEQPLRLLDSQLSMSGAADALRFAGKLRVIETEGTLWTPEERSRIRLLDDRQLAWYSLAVAGEFLVCGGHDIWPIGRGASFATLRADSLGRLRVAKNDFYWVITPRWMVGDRHGGFHFASTGALDSATIEPDGTVVLGEHLSFTDVRDLVASPGLDHVYLARDAGVTIYRVESAGVLTPHSTLLPATVRIPDIEVWFDAERGVDRLAATVPDSLYVFEIDPAGEAEVLLAEGGVAAFQVLFLDSGRLLCRDGRDRAWLRKGPLLEHKVNMELPQDWVQALALAPDGNAWASIGSRYFSTALAFGTGIGASLAGPGKWREIASVNAVAISETHIYATPSSSFTGQPDTIHVFERSDSLALIDSVPTVTESAGMNWLLMNDFLVTSNETFDLGDSPIPVPLGQFRPWIGARSFTARPFPGHDTDLLAAGEFGLDDSLALYRVSREGGVEQTWVHVHPRLYSALAFDDRRDLLYRSHSQEITVYDVSDPYQVAILHTYHFPQVEDWREIGGLAALEGVLHVYDFNGLSSENWRRHLTPIWFDGESFVPAGAMLEVPFTDIFIHNRGGHIVWAEGASAGLLGYDPPPLPRRLEHPAGGY